MVLRERDPDIFRWGLHHLLPPDPDAQPQPQPVDEVKLQQHDNHAVHNDEVIAQALQEEFSHIALAEASGAHHHSASALHVLTQQWTWTSPHVPSPASDSGLPAPAPKPPQEEDEEPETCREPFSSCSSPGDDIDNAQAQPHGSDSHPCLLQHLMDVFSLLDGQVGQRLNDLLPVPHVPKTNGEIPSVDQAISDHQRLLDRLALYGLDELKVKGDDNCQFRALSDQFYRTTEHHRFVRQQVLKQLESQPEIYAGYVPMDYREYLKIMSKSGEWGNHVTLQAAADSYGVKIFILTSFKDTCYIEILPVVEKSKRVICLSFWAEVHYNSIYPEGEFSLGEQKEKLVAVLAFSGTPIPV